jgi:hypothetical protein
MALAQHYDAEKTASVALTALPGCVINLRTVFEMNSE